MNQKQIPDNFKPLPDISGSSCFGCGPGNAMGLHMNFHTDGKSLVSQVSVPEQLCGWQNVVHGGITSTILDEIMGWTIIYLLKKVALTKTMSVNFLKPLFVQQPLYVEGQLAERPDERHAVARSAIYNRDDELCATGEGTFTVFAFDDAVALGFLEPKMIAELFEKFML